MNLLLVLFQESAGWSLLIVKRWHKCGVSRHVVEVGRAGQGPREVVADIGADFQDGKVGDWKFVDGVAIFRSE